MIAGARLQDTDRIRGPTMTRMEPTGQTMYPRGLIPDLDADRSSTHRSTP